MNRKRLEFTGERYVPNIDWPEISYEHWHRYFFASQFTAGKVVLDLSSGEGFGSHLLAERAEKVIGVDIDPQAVAHATARYVRPNLEFRSGSADDVPIHGDHAVDVIVSFETIEHLDERQQIGFAKECKRLLKPNGQLILSTPNKLLYSDRHEFRNEFHFREFYVDEFLGFLGEYFRHVTLLGQRVYPSSIIWPVEQAATALSEFQLAYDDGEYRPAGDDRKELLYLLAVCSDASDTAALTHSILLDVSERATAARAQELSAREGELESLKGRHEEIQAEVQALHITAKETQEKAEYALATIADRDGAIHHLKGQLTQAESRVNAAQMEMKLLREATREEAESHVSLRALQDERASIERDLADRRLEQANLDHAILEKHLASALAELDILDRGASTMKVEQEDLANKLAAALDDKDAVEKRIAELERAHLQLLADIEDAAIEQIGPDEAPYGELDAPAKSIIVYVVGELDPGAEHHPLRREFPPIVRGPGQSESAHLALVAQLVGEAIAAGGTHLLVPAEHAGWLNDHSHVADYLSEYHELAEASPDTGIVFALRPGERTPEGTDSSETGPTARPGIDHLRFAVDYPNTLPLDPPKTALDPDHLDLHWLMSDFGKGMGGPMTIFRIIKYLEEFGHTNTIWTTASSHRADARRMRRMIGDSFLPLDADVRILAGHLDEVSGDAVIATHCSTAYPARAITNVRERFYFVQDFEPYFYPMGSRYLLAENTYRFGFSCIAASPWLRDVLAANYGAKSDHFALAYDPSIYYPDQRVRRKTRHIGFYARIGTERRVVELGLLALERVAREFPELVVHFFGDWLRDFSPPYAYKNHGVLTEPELANLYRRISLGVVFSSSNYSLIPNEMMACGLPVVELAGPCTTAVYPDGAVALAEPNPVAMADTIINLLADKDLRETQRARGLEHVSGLSWERSARRVESALIAGIQARSPDMAVSRPAKASARRSVRRPRRADVMPSDPSFKRPIVFVGQPEYFRQTYFDETSSGLSYEYPITSADPSALRDLPAFVKERGARTCIVFRPEWFSWYREAFDRLKSDGVALIGYSTEPVPHNWANPHPDQLQRLKSLKGALHLDYDLIVHFDRCSLRLLQEVGFKRIIAHPLPVSSKLFYPEDLPQDFDVCFLGRSTPHREEYLVPLKARYNTLHVVHGLTDNDARTLMNRSKMVVNIHTHEYPSFETRNVMALLCQRPLLSEALSGDYLEAGRDYTLVKSPCDLKEEVERILAGRRVPAVKADLSTFSIESLMATLGVV